MEKGQNAPQTNAYPVAQAPYDPAYHQPTAYNPYNAQPVYTSVAVVRTRPDNYLCFAIFVTLCCCVPLGIVGIVYSVKSSSKFDHGDDYGALADGTSARNWSIAGLVIGVVLIVILIILNVAVASTNTSTSTTAYP